MADKPQLSVRVEPEMLKAIKNKCEAEGITITEFCIAAYEAALSDDFVVAGSNTQYIEKRITEMLAPIRKKLEVLEEAILGELNA